jgi:hypothetical protein
MWNRFLKFCNVLAVILVILVIGHLGGGFESDTAYCGVCAMKQDTSRFLWIPRRTFIRSALTDFHDDLRDGLCPDHSWISAGGAGGATYSFSYGKGRLLHGAWASPHLYRVLNTIRENRGDAEAELWLDRLLNPDESHDAMWALGMLVESEDFAADYVRVLVEAETVGVTRKLSEQGEDTDAE